MKSYSNEACRDTNKFSKFMSSDDGVVPRQSAS
jgi:hypothetical protein